MVIAVFAKPDAGRNRHLRLRQQFLGELERSHGPIGLGDTRPDEHGGLGFLHQPAGGEQTVAQHITPVLVGLPDFLKAVLRPFEREDARDLNRREHAVVEIRLEPGKRRHQLAIPAHETDAPAGHVVTFGKGKKFDRDVLGAAHLQNRRRAVTIEHDIGIGQIVHHPDAMLFRHGNDLLEKIQIDALRRRIGRKIKHQHLGFGPDILDGIFQFCEEIDAGHERNMADVGPRDHETVGMDRIARVRYQHRVALVHRRQRQVRQAFLGADGHNRLAVHVDIDVVATLVPLADGAPQARYAARHRIPVRVFALGGFDELVHDMPGRGAIGIAHPEVDDVLAAPTRLRLDLVDDVEDVGWQPLYAGEFVVL